MFRQITARLEELLRQPKPPVILIVGMRQTGKSTLARHVGEQFGLVKFNFDLVSDQRQFTEQDRHSLALFARQHQGKLILVDEIQKKPEATAIVKHLYDGYGLKFILTGSSEIKMRRGMGDSLAGRIHEIRLYPLSLSEINIQSGLQFDPAQEFNHYEENQQLLLRYLVYGSLPQLQNIPFDRYREYLLDFTNTIFSKDILEVAGTRKSTQVYALARLLALQVGQLVNFNELAMNIETSRETVYRYIDVFEQMGLIIRAKPISTNEREAISKATKIYFTDLGLRNALIEDFSDFGQRNDKGQLLENAVFTGLKRSLDYSRRPARLGFFRSVYGSEIDIVEKDNDHEKLLEVKVRAATRSKSNITPVTLQDAQKYLY